VFSPGPLALAAEPLHFPSIDPTPPETAESTFETLHGFKMRLIAAEPLVADPVAITYDEDGRAYVCEMSDYPYTDKAHHKPSQENPTDQPIGKVRLLTDTDDDGVFDKATVFADGLSWPTGSACWKGGIIVVATPDIWYFKDTDGDGVADVRQKLFTGLKKLNVQAVANNPIWGLDNKIYIAGGSNGGEIKNLVHPDEKPLTVRRADLRLDPVTMKIELTSGGARFGNTRDDWGNRFLCNIRNPAEHIVIDLKYLARNPYLPPVNPLHDAAEAGDQLPVHRISPPEAWRVLRAERWSAEGSHLPHSELVGSGVVTSSSGITCYRGDAYPEKFRGNLFVADVAANLFYRLIPEPDGVTFKANRSPEDGDKEFCASRDIWCRPVNFANAPDGTLTVCDMYREAIEHPWSLPDDIHAALDLERGRDKGRLYRMTPPKFARRKTPHLGKASTEELVKLLEHPNAWHRETAHRLLFERQDTRAVPLLKGMAEKNANALAKVEAMWTLEGLSALSDDLLEVVVRNDEPRVQEQAIDLVAPRLTDPAKHKNLRNWLNSAVASDAPRVRFRSVLAIEGLSEKLSPEERQKEAHALMPYLAGKVRYDASDEWIRLAYLCHRPDWVISLVHSISLTSTESIPDDFLLAGARVLSAAGDKDDIAILVEQLPHIAEGKAQLAEKVLAELAGGIARVKLRAGEKGLAPGAATWLRDTMSQQPARATTTTLSLEDRTRAIALLSLEEFSTLQPIATRLLQPSEPDAIRLAIIQLLRQKPNKEISEVLLTAWPTLTPATREAAAQALASRTAWTEAMLTAVEQKQIKPSEISPTIRASLQRLTLPALRDRASKLFAPSGTRAEILAKYQPALSLKGDATSGHVIYTTVCAVCHRKGVEGRDIGPNLATVQSWTDEQILTNILDPNREVSPNFLLYAVELTDGRTLAGLITSETPASIALKGADGIELNIARSDVKSLKSTGMSLMPEGLEAALTPQQVADVMAFLRAH
jgi:putative membrane-bound dehydrogenase-like protein